MEIQLPHGKRHSSLPNFFGPCLYCGQKAGWIRISLGTEVGLSPGAIVLDGDPALLTERDTAVTPALLGTLCCGTVVDLSNCWALIN